MQTVKTYFEKGVIKTEIPGFIEIDFDLTRTDVFDSAIQNKLITSRSIYHISMNGKYLGTAETYFISRTERFEVADIIVEIRNKGIGTAFMKKLIEDAEGMGATSIILDALVEVVPFYTKLGFEPVPQPSHQAVGLQFMIMEI